jgi:hypothetical protein
MAHGKKGMVLLQSAASPAATDAVALRRVCTTDPTADPGYQAW